MCIRIFLGEKTMDRLASFEETEEIKSAKVLRINDVLQQPERLREGVAASLRYIQDEGLLNVAPGNLRPFEPSPVMYVGKDTIPHA
jgi:hypothetical protein